LPLPRFASIPQGSPQVPGTCCRCLGLLAFLGVSLRCQAPVAAPPGARHPSPPPRFASVPQGFPSGARVPSGARHPLPVPPRFPSGARHPLPPPRFASVPQGFPQVPGTRCRCLGSSRVAVRRVLEGVFAECFATPERLVHLRKSTLADLGRR
jgi:hypothetical protein